MTEENIIDKYCIFEKQNLVTRADMTDLLKCRKCGGTFVRHGFHTPTNKICGKYLEAQREKMTKAFEGG